MFWFMRNIASVTRSRRAIALWAVMVTLGVVLAAVWLSATAYADTYQPDPAGACYNDRGAIVAQAPCHIVVNADGSADVYSDAN